MLTIHVPSAVVALLRVTAAAAGVEPDVVAAVALEQFTRLPRGQRQGFVADFVQDNTGPREVLELPPPGLKPNEVLAALWLFAALPEGDRLALVGRRGS